MKAEAIKKSTLQIDDIDIELVQKKMKNIHLRVYPPDGNVRMSAPLRMDKEKLRSFAQSKLEWIRTQQSRIRGFKGAAIIPVKFMTEEKHYFGGQCFNLKLIERSGKPDVVINGDRMELYVRPGATAEKRKAVLEQWYRGQLKELLPELIAHWEKVLHVKISEFGVKKMKTKWGTCNRKARRIWINLELAKKSPKCLEYIVVHELVHLLERGHNSIFYGYMDRYLPEWRLYKKELNNWANR